MAEPTSANVSETMLTGARAKAAVHVAQDILTDTEIAADCGVSQRTLERWKLRPEFRAAVDSEKTKIVEALRAEGLIVKQNRIAAAQRRSDAIDLIVAERGSDPEMQDVPGGKSGWLTRDIKLVKVVDESDPENGQRVYQREYWVYAVDTAVMREQREIEKHIAIETGQWEEKQNITGDVLLRRYVGVDPDDV